MPKKQTQSLLLDRIAKLEQQLVDAKATVEILYNDLNDASSVVNAGDDEDYAYQASLEAGAKLLGIER